MSRHIKKDSLGEKQIPEGKLWGSQTQRSLENFKIGNDPIPFEMLASLALIKECCAKVNAELKLLDPEASLLIQKVAQDVQEAKLKDHFPLVVWQTGSGTQTNMNMNEVIANRASELAEQASKKIKIHPNDDVNKSQSTNDTFPSAMRITTVKKISQDLLPALESFEQVLGDKAQSFKEIIKVGRTHLMDAVPLTLGQEFSCFQKQIHLARKRIQNHLPELLALPLGGTAVGTGLNAPPQFAKKVVQLLAQKTRLDFVSADNKFEGIASHDSLVAVSGSLKALAVSLLKIVNDIRLLASGPRAGLGELKLKANEPGSSIMPGKVNPTQCEALAMVCVQVIGQDLSISFAGSQGQFQLNAYKPMIIFNLFKSLSLLTDGLNSFRTKCLIDLQADEQKIKEYLDRSLMMVTALNPHLGYDKAAQIAKQAHEKGLTLKEAALQSGWLTEKEFDLFIQVKKMV